VYSSGALAVEDSQAYRIKKARLVGLCAENPETSAALMKRLASVVNSKSDPARGEILRILTTGVTS
jgi:CRP-like cAMP-binding protein